MSRPEQQACVASVRQRFPQFFTGTRVLEVGSLDINGSVRGQFTGCDYIGVDVAPGPGVDVVAQGQALDYDDEAFDVVISCECFEHNPYWLETFANMRRMCRGLVVFTCATTGRHEHGTTRTTPADSPLTVGLGWNYYRNLTADDFRDALPLDDLFMEHEFAVEDSTHDLYFWGLVGGPVGGGPVLRSGHA